MLDETISDSRLHRMLAAHLKKSVNGRTAKLTGIRLCGSQVMHFQGMAHNVYVTSNGENASFFGTTQCHSAWACPRCTAKVMAEKAAKIACLIDAQATWNNEYAFMLTFTLPHENFMSCMEAFQVLMETWRMFNRVAKAKNSKGKSQGAWGEFREKFGIKYMVRVYEATWGDAHGWHPHIHALFWTKPNNFKDLLAYEDKLTDLWLHCAVQCHAKIVEKMARDAFKVDMGAKAIQELLRKIDLDSLSTQLREELKPLMKRKKFRADERLKVVEAFSKSGNKPDMDNFDCYSRYYARTASQLEQLYADYKRRPVTGHRAVYFSRDNNGNVRRESSSRYISGWGANSELTRSQMKTAHVMDGRYTPFEMLKLAYEAKDPAVKEQWLDRFVDYALATFKHRRCQFSQNCGKLIRKWQESEEYIQVFKKKFMDKETAMWKTVYWFSEKQWLNVLATEEVIPDLREQVLKLACEENARDKICEYLWRCGLEVNLEEHPQEKIICNYYSFAPRTDVA